jgi:hypothetical protein
MHRVSAQNEDSRFKQAAANFFAAKVQISTSESGPKWRFRTRKAAATFSLSMLQYVRSPLFQDGVSGVHGIDTIYKNGGLLGEFFLTV